MIQYLITIIYMIESGKIGVDVGLKCLMEEVCFELGML